MMCFALNALSGVLQIADLSIISYGLPAVYTELAIHSGFMVWKAKVENCRKHKDINRMEEMEGEI